MTPAVLADGGELAGVVLGSEDATPLELWIGVHTHRVVQLDDVVVVHSALPDGMVVAYYGVVDQIRKRFEGASFDSDAFRAADGTLPVEISCAAHVRITRIDPEVFAPPTPGSTAIVVRDEAFQRALYFDRMERKVAIGLTRTGEPVFANLEFLDGTRGAHASISGISGVATKTSYASFLLYSIFHSPALGLEVANTKALIFNVKGEDLLWLDHCNVRIDERARGEYLRLGLPVGAFQSVGLYAPARRGTSVAIPDTGTRQLGVSPYRWTLGELARHRLLRFAFADADDARAQVSFVIDRVEAALFQATRSLAPEAAHVTLDGRALRSFDDLVDLLDGAALDRVVGGRAASGTLDAFRRRLHAAAQHLAHLVCDDGGPPRRIEWRDHQVTVVDIHRLHAVAQMFVVGALVKRAMEEKEAAGASRPLLFVVLDELNKYAPRTGWSPLSDLLLDVAERGRSLGVSLLGAQQTASEVERRVVANAALRIAGRLDAAEAERGEYGWLTRVARQRAAMLQPGSLLVAQPEIPTLIAGNHDSGARLEAWGQLAELVGVHAVGRPRHPDDGGVIELVTRGGERAVIGAIPFAAPRTLVTALQLATDQTTAMQRYADGLRAIVALCAERFRTDAVNLLCLHTHLDGAAFTGSERRVHLGDDWAALPRALPPAAHYIALGHIHRPQSVAAPSPAEYAGSPLQLDFGESGEAKSFVRIDAVPGRPAQIRRVPYRGARPLTVVRATLDELAARRDELAAAGWLKITVDAAEPDPELSRQVRALLDNTVAVDLACPLRDPDPAAVSVTEGGPPAEVYRAWFSRTHGRDVDDATLRAFDALMADTTGGAA